MRMRYAPGYDPTNAYSEWINDIVIKVLNEAPPSIDGEERQGEDIFNATAAICAGVLANIIQDAHDPEIALNACTKLASGTFEELHRLKPQLEATAAEERETNAVRGDGGCLYCDADQGEAHRPGCPKETRQ